MVTHKRYQYPVGQGYFHSGEVQLGSSTFHYIYDCGADKDDLPALHREVTAYTDNQHSTVDALFLSHLHDDHVIGLDRLLGLVTVDTVILPYLSVFERILLAVEATEQGAVNGTYLQLLGDPARWFFDRGVARVIFIRGDNSGEGPLPELPDVPADFPDAERVEHPHKTIQLDWLALERFRVHPSASKSA